MFSICNKFAKNLIDLIEVLSFENAMFGGCANCTSSFVEATRDIFFSFRGKFAVTINTLVKY